MAMSRNIPRAEPYPARGAAGRRCRGFTLIELLIVITIIAIAFGLAAPTIGDSREMRLREAARLLAADLEFAAVDSIAHAADPRLVKVDLNNHRYWVAAATAPDTPLTETVTQQPYLVTFGSGRAAGCAGVTIQSVSLGGDNQIMFDAFASPDQTTDAGITLASGAATLQVVVKAGTGEVHIP